MMDKQVVLLDGSRANGAIEVRLNYSYQIVNNNAIVMTNLH